MDDILSRNNEHRNLLQTNVGMDTVVLAYNFVRYKVARGCSAEIL